MNMEKFKIKDFIWSTLLLIISLICFILGYISFGIIFFLFGLFGIIWKVFFEDRVEQFSKKWIYINMIVLIFASIITRFLTSQAKWTITEVVLGIIFLGFTYLLFRLLTPKLAAQMKEKDK